LSLTITFGFHTVLGLEVTNQWLDGGTTLHLAEDGFGDAVDLVGVLPKRLE
jgi:hypothetical protein